MAMKHHPKPMWKTGLMNVIVAGGCLKKKAVNVVKKRLVSIIIIILARTPEITQGLGRILSCGARKPEQT